MQDSTYQNYFIRHTFFQDAKNFALCVDRQSSPVRGRILRSESASCQQCGSQSHVVIVAVRILAASAHFTSMIFMLFPPVLHSNHDWKVTKR
jgi:hypothetical protein